MKVFRSLKQANKQIKHPHHFPSVSFLCFPSHAAFKSSSPRQRHQTRTPAFSVKGRHRRVQDVTTHLTPSCTSLTRRKQQGSHILVLAGISAEAFRRLLLAQARSAGRPRPLRKAPYRRELPHPEPRQAGSCRGAAQSPGPPGPAHVRSRSAAAASLSCLPAPSAGEDAEVHLSLRQTRSSESQARTEAAE